MLTLEIYVSVMEVKDIILIMSMKLEVAVFIHDILQSRKILYCTVLSIFLPGNLNFFLLSDKVWSRLHPNLNLPMRWDLL